jgi:hypothetical protein
MIVCEMPDPVKDLLELRYNIIGHTHMCEFDNDFDELRKKFKTIQRDSFEPNDRFIIEHMDTDFYFDLCPVGINFMNVFTVAAEFDIPAYVLLFYTNHYGIQDEIDILCQHNHPNDRPTVIESSWSKWMFNSAECDNISLDLEKIEYPVLCMMNGNRSHRHALYHQLKDIDPSNIILTIKKHNDS